MPTLAGLYGVFGVFVAAIELFAQPAVTSAVLRGPDVLAQLLFTPLVAASSIWVSIAISARSSDPRVAAQLSVIASLPSIVVTTVIALGGIHGRPPSPSRWRPYGAADGFGWRIVSVTFDRERLVTGSRVMTTVRSAVAAGPWRRARGVRRRVRSERTNRPPAPA